MRVGLLNVSAIPDIDQGTIVNDIHWRLNATRVGEIIKPATVGALSRNAHGRGLTLKPIIQHYRQMLM